MMYYYLLLTDDDEDVVLAAPQMYCHNERDWRHIGQESTARGNFVAMVTDKETIGLASPVVAETRDLTQQQRRIRKSIPT